MNPNGNGIGYWHLSPDQPLTRQEAAVLIVRALGYSMEAQRPSLHDDVQPTPLSFADAGAIPVWLMEWVEIARRTGVMGGYPNGTFQPANRIKRAEAVVMLERFAARQPITPDVTQELRPRQPDCLDYYNGIDPRRTTPLRATARASGSSSEVYEVFQTLSAAEQEELLRAFALAFWEQVKDRSDLGQNVSGVRVALETSGYFELASATYNGVTFSPRFHLKALGTATPDMLPTLTAAFTYTGRYLTVTNQAQSLADWLKGAKLVYTPPPLIKVPPPSDPPEAAARQVFETFIYTLGRLPN